MNGPTASLTSRHGALSAPSVMSTTSKALDGGDADDRPRDDGAHPWGPLGAVAARVLLAPYLRRLLRQRAAHIRSLGGSPRTVGCDDAGGVS